MSNEDFYNSPKKGAENVLVRLPTGQMVSLDQLLSEEGQEHVEINVARLKIGDLVIADYANQRGADNDEKPGRFSIKFMEPQWAYLGIGENFGPTKHWTVEVNGLPPKKPRPYRAGYGGAGWGGSMLSPDVIATDRSLVFLLPDLLEMRSPFVTKLAIVRQESVGGSEVHRLIKPEELASSDEHIRAMHETRMAQYAKLMEKFGFAKKYDFRDGTRSSSDDPRMNWVYENDIFAATYDASMGMGNSLIIFNKKDHSYTHYNYYNYKNRDALQVCYSDLEGSGEPFNPHEYGSLIMGDSMVHRSGSSIVTYNTSPNTSLEAINYQVSDSDATDLLHIPLYGNWKNVMAPNIEIYPDRTSRIPEGYPMTLLTKQDPEIFNKIRSSVAIEKTEERTTVVFNGVKRPLRTPDEIYSALQTETKNES